jgi:NAD(P) transhydrogenase
MWPLSVWNEIITNCVELASSNAQDAKRQLEFAGVTYIEGLASFPDSGGTGSISVTLPNDSIQIVKADMYLLATGSKPFRPGGVPFDGKRIFDSDSINQVSGTTHVREPVLYPR